MLVALAFLFDGLWLVGTLTLRYGRGGGTDYLGARAITHSLLFLELKVLPLGCAIFEVVHLTQQQRQCLLAHSNTIFAVLQGHVRLHLMCRWLISILLIHLIALLHLLRERLIVLLLLSLHFSLLLLCLPLLVLGLLSVGCRNWNLHSLLLLFTLRGSIAFLASGWLPIETTAGELISVEPIEAGFATTLRLILQPKGAFS